MCITFSYTSFIFGALAWDKAYDEGDGNAREIALHACAQVRLFVSLQ